MNTQNDLLKFFEHADHRLIHKWLPYFDVYDRHLLKFRGREVSLLEFGVYHGGSLQMWKHYLGPQAKIVGVDIDERCVAFAEDQIEIVIADQSDRVSLGNIKSRYPKFDIIIDDGGHNMEHQINTIKEFLFYTSDEGVYICEDTHSSYMAKHGGAYKRGSSFIEYTKNIIDQLNSFHSETPNLVIDDHSRCLNSIHYYDSMVVIEKKVPNAKGPSHRMFGTPSWDASEDELKFIEGSAKLPKITSP